MLPGSRGKNGGRAKRGPKILVYTYTHNKESSIRVKKLRVFFYDFLFGTIPLVKMSDQPRLKVPTLSFIDKTPTPTRLLKAVDEIGLQLDSAKSTASSSNNPFDEHKSCACDCLYDSCRSNIKVWNDRDLFYKTFNKSRVMIANFTYESSYEKPKCMSVCPRKIYMV